MVSEYNMVDIFGFREQWRQVNKKKMRQAYSQAH